MATDATKARSWLSGGVFKGLTTAAAPTGTSGAPTGFTDLGYISDDGVEIEVPGAGNSTAIKGWQNGDTVRVVRTASEDNPKWKFTMLETSLATVETYFGVTVTPGATEGSFEFKVQNRPYASYVVDGIDGAELQRDYIPMGVVTDVGAHTMKNGELTGYEVTIEGELDATKGYNFKRWATSLKT